MASKDESYEVTGKVCPPKLPMDNVNMDNWLIIPSSLMESIFTEIPIEGTKISRSTSLCALSSQANVVLSSNGLSHSSVSLPYYFCNFCDHHTDNKAALLRHMSSKHVFKCLFCDFISFTRCGLIQHQLFKHVDAEEMQPILTTKTIQLNTSQLQRHFRYLIQFKDSCDSHSGMGVESDDPVNSSHLNTLSEAESGENYFLSLEKKGNYTLSVQKEDLDSATVSQAINSTTNGAQQESISFSSVPRMIGEDSDRHKSFAKDSHFRDKGDGFKASDQYKAEIPNIKSVPDMPHFLDESDSSVTSSSNHQSTSPQAHQKRRIRGLQSVHETESTAKDQVPSFLTDPLIAPKIVGNANWKPPGSDSSHNIVKKIIRWCVDENSLETCGNESKTMFNSLCTDDKSRSHPAINTTTSEPGCVKAVLKSPESVLNKMPTEGREGSLSPNLSSLSVERLQKQLEEAVSNSPGFTFLESLKSSQPLSNNLSLAADSNVSSVNVSPHILSGSKQGFGCFVDDSESVKKDVDNFLLTAEDQQDSDRHDCGETQFKRRNTADKNLECKGQPPAAAKQKKIENYDLLRNLLVQKPKDTMKHFAHNTKELIGISPNRNTSPMTSNPTMPDLAMARQRTASNLMTLRTRASDMSLKDLLIGNHPQVNSPRPAVSNKDINPSQNMNIFLVCGYCNFESANKEHFDAHVDMCKQMNHDMKDYESLQESSDMIYDHVKQEPLDNSCGAASSTFSSGEFSASGLLKSLTAHSAIKKNKSPLTAGAHHICDIFKGVARKHEMKQTNDKISSISKFHHEFHDNKDLSLTTSDNIHGLGLGLSKATSLHSSPNIKNFDAESSNPVTRKRKYRKDEDLDYVYESENSSDTDSTSECDYKINSVQNHKRQERKKVKEACEHGTSGLQMLAKHGFQDPQTKQLKINLVCFRCSYCTENKIAMRQHLILKHPNCVPFARALFENKKEGLLYFCCGLNASCSFFSIEGTEIFEHIKHCYSGLLDNFLDVSAVEYVDYSQALGSLGIAAKQLDSSPTTYYCLRCNFSQTKFQPIAYHVATNHPETVAGVLLVSRVLADTQVLMVCLSCNAHVTSKEWSVHRCRILDADTCQGNILAPCNTSVSTPTTKILPSEHKLLASLENSDQGKVSLLCELMAAEKGKIVQGSNKQSSESSLFNCKDEDHELASEMRCQSPAVEVLHIKQEIQECEDNFDVPVHFQLESQDSLDTNSDNEANNTGINLAMTGPERTEATFKQYPNKGTSHSSVLQNLLTAPKVSDFNLKSFSLLQNLLKCPQVDKEQPQPSLSVGNDVASAPLGSPQSKYSAILESLSRQVFTSHQTVTNSLGQIATASLDTSQSVSKSVATGMTKSISYKDLSSNLGQRLWNSETIKKEDIFSSPNHSGISPLSLSEGSTCVHPSQLSPPLIPTTPVLPPLSPPPSADRVLHPDTQNTHAPFSNLLRGLLSKINSKVSTHNHDS